LIVHGDAAATADHIRAATTLYRIGIASDLCGEILFVFVGLALYRLFEAVDRNTAVQMASLVLISVPIALLAVVNELATLIVLSGPSFLSTFTKPQLDSLAYLFIRLHGESILVAEILWGLWLVPFGRLVMRSGFLPRILGVMLLIAAPGYLLRAAANLFPTPAALDSVGRVLSLGELPIIFWLAILGARDQSERIPGATT